MNFQFIRNLILLL